MYQSSIWMDTCLTMKKFISLALVAVMLVASVSVVAAAAAADWVAGNGFNIIAKDKSEVSKNSPVTVTDGANGAVAVSHGGYYQNGKDWGGVASTNAYNLNGLEVTIKFDQVPEATAADDCWISIDFLEKAQLFQVGDVAGNRGFMNLIRFSRPFIEVYEGVTSFNKVGDSQSATDNSMFAIKSGDTVKYKVTYADSQYKFTFSNGDKSYEIPAAQTKQLTDVFATGKAHIAVAASLMGSEKDAFKYQIVSITDGKEKTAEEIAAEAKAKEEAKAKAEADKKAKEEAKAKEKAEKEAQKAADAADKAANGDTKKTDDKKATDNKAAETIATASTGMSTATIIWIVIAVIVVIAIIVVAVVMSKKKNNKK